MLVHSADDNTLEPRYLKWSPNWFDQCIISVILPQLWNLGFSCNLRLIQPPFDDIWKFVPVRDSNPDLPLIASGRLTTHAMRARARARPKPPYVTESLPFIVVRCSNHLRLAKHIIGFPPQRNGTMRYWDNLRRSASPWLVHTEISQIILHISDTAVYDFSLPRSTEVGLHIMCLSSLRCSEHLTTTRGRHCVTYGGFGLAVPCARIAQVVKAPARGKREIRVRVSVRHKYSCVTKGWLN